MSRYIIRFPSFKKRVCKGLVNYFAVILPPFVQLYPAPLLLKLVHS